MFDASTDWSPKTMKTLLLLLLAGAANALDLRPSYNAAGINLIPTSITTTGNGSIGGPSFTVGTSSFTVSGGSATVAYGLTTVSLTANGGFTTLRAKESQYELGLSSTADTSTGKFFIGTNTDGVTPTRQALVFSNNAGAELARITNAGNVGIGTTSPASTATLHVNGTIIYKGVTDGVDASSGTYGELISTTGILANQDLPATGIQTSIATTTLSAGCWMISALGYLDSGASSAITDAFASISKTANAAENINYTGEIAATMTVSASWTLVPKPRFLCVTVPTSIFLVGAVTYTVRGGAVWHGTRSSIEAVRFR